MMRTKWSWATVGMLALCASALLAAPASAAGTCSASTPQYCPAPSVQTGPATNVTANSATLTGTVNPNGAPTLCSFAYGTSTKYTSTTPPQSLPAGTNAVTVTAPIDGLQSNTTFHYALACENAGGPGVGADRTFTTLDHGPSQLSLPQKAGFVSHSRMVGFVVGCFGDRDCNGTLTLTKGRGTLASSSFHVRSQTNGVVMLKLSKKEYKALRRSHHGIRARLTATDSDGQKASHNVTLHRWV